MATLIAPLYQILQRVPDASGGNLYIGRTLAAGAPILQRSFIDSQPLCGFGGIEV